MRSVSVIALIWLAGLINLQAKAMDLPVLPYPQAHVVGKSVIKLSRNIKFIGVSAAIQNRLTANWKLLANEYPVKGNLQIITLVLAGQSTPNIALVNKTEPDWESKIGNEGYVLILNAKQKVIAANTEAGLFYGLQSLKQLTRAGWNHELVITDWPSFAHRGIYDDISRGPISKVSVIKKQIERLAELKFNSLSFYIEHVVQPLSYPDFAPANGKLTMADIRELSAYAAKFHMELVGSFQSFGHFNNILSLPKYQSMGETSTMISPLDPKARKFLSSVITELCGAFNSPYFNVNCDETFDLGKGKSKAYVDSVGVAKYYADHIKFLYDVLKKNHKQLMMWGDIALQHEEILDMLPRDIIYLTWEYGDQKSFDAWIQPFVKRGLQFMVCPGVVNSNRMFPDLLLAKANINGFLSAGKQNGAIGALTTVWDDGGMCSFSADWYGVYTAAEKSWNASVADTSSFNTRYERNAYGTANGEYLKALSKLMELRNIPLTYNLADQLWTQKILPAKGKTLIINNTDAGKVLATVDAGLSYINTAKPQRNKADAAYLKFSLQQYQLLMDSRTQLAQVADNYRQMGAKVNTAQLNKDIRVIAGLENRYRTLKITYTALWNAENQPYWLDVNLKVFDGKINDLHQLKSNLIGAINHPAALPTAGNISLNIKSSDSFYFQNWLLSGPFKTTTVPAFLYSEDATYNVPPKPGDMAQYQGKNYRWMKYISQDGGIVDLADYYKTNKDAVAYAYCAITTDNAHPVTALISGTGIQVYLNGNAVTAQGARNVDGETPFNLSFKKGANHIVLKIPTQINEWAYTFRLDTKEPITNHKQKYTLNAKNSIHEAD